MPSEIKKTDEVKNDLQQYREAFKASADYCQPQWEAYLRLYKLWRGVKPPEMDATLSNIWVNIFHSMVSNRMPLIFENVFSHPEYVTLKPDSPEYDLMADGAQAWIRDLLDDKIKIRSDAIPTVQSALIGGTGYRTPYVRYVERDGQQVPVVSSKNVNFFNILPSPNGSMINPSDYHVSYGVDWIFEIDWWSEDKIKADAKRKGFNKKEIDRMFQDSEDPSGRRGEEDNYKDQFKQINGMSYEGYGAQSEKFSGKVSGALKKRRVVHWHRRDVHIIVAEDEYVIFKDDPHMGKGVIPVTKYTVAPDLTNFFGISSIELVEDLVMAMIMNLNYRMDHELGVMFPTTWIRDDIKRGKSEDDFIPRPYAVNFFPDSVSDISKAIHYDRRPEVSQTTFIEEDRLKALLQSVSGELETTGSFGDVVGNRSATGVTTIAGKLAARPNFEATVLEQTGFREEIWLLLKLGDQHINTVVDVPVPAANGAPAWRRVSPLDITDKFSVIMHGARYMAERDQSFQRLMALMPMWYGDESVDKQELNHQVTKTYDILPEPNKIFPPASPPVAAPARPPELPGEVGGIASALNMNNTQRSIENRNQVEPAGAGGQRGF